MTGILDTVDQRTRLVGQNRFELLLFRLGRQQLFAINVFKVKEVLKLPRLNSLPNSNPLICGIANMRGQTVPVIDLSVAIGMPPIADLSQAHLIVSEYNGTVQGFLVSDVERIINLDWSDVLPPPATAGRAHYLTAITRLEDNRLVEIVDVEKVLAEITPFTTEISEHIGDEQVRELAREAELMIVDDSLTAREQVKKTMSQLGVQVTEAVNGSDALAQLKGWADAGIDVPGKLLMVITDAEMPVMDGYRLVHEIRADERLKGLHIILHTSLSGAFNKEMVRKVGCDDFLPKFESNRLAERVLDRVKQLHNT
jgi:two-component system chemotaxis response regulator CheV